MLLMIDILNTVERQGKKKKLIHSDFEEVFNTLKMLLKNVFLLV